MENNQVSTLIPQNSRNHNKKWLVVLVLALVFIIAASVGYFVFYKNKHQVKTNLEAPKPLKIVKNNIEEKGLASYIPKDFPLEDKAKIVQNYDAKTEDGRRQGTTSFETDKSLDDNLKIYSDYFTKNDWKVVSKSDQKTVKSISAVKKDVKVQVNITENSVSKKKTVTINAGPVK